MRQVIHLKNHLMSAFLSTEICMWQTVCLKKHLLVTFSSTGICMWLTIHLKMRLLWTYFSADTCVWQTIHLKRNFLVTFLSTGICLWLTIHLKNHLVSDFSLTCSAAQVNFISVSAFQQLQTWGRGTCCQAPRASSQAEGSHLFGHIAPIKWGSTLCDDVKR